MFKITFYYKNEKQVKTFTNDIECLNFWGLIQADSDIHGIFILTS